MLTNDLTAKQQAFSTISAALDASHIKIFRYVSWASNGVSEKLLAPLNQEILQDLTTLTTRIDALAARPNFSSSEQAVLLQIQAQWKGGNSQARDTLDIGQTDAPMATMMMGQTDDIFNAVFIQLGNLASVTTQSANTLRDQLAQDAERNKQVILVVTAIGFIISAVVALVIGRSIVQPIRSITDVMRRLSGGEIDARMTLGDRSDEIGQMAQAIDVFRNNIIDKRAMDQTLTDAIEAISEGFSLYDAHDRLVVCNTHYRDLFSYGPDTVAPGTSFEQIIRSSVGRGAIDGSENAGDWVAERMARHRNPAGPHVQRRSDGRWVRVSERRTSTGGVVATYTDITEIKTREAELDAAHAQVTALNRQLQTDNQRMEGELDVTRRLQLMLLPTNDELRKIPGLEIACHMAPALEVGGDYYDVLQHDGQVMIGIGDVTGHGLESGVVMLLTQAMVRALLTSGETDPVRFLSTLNRALYGNVQRMGSDKNLTLCLLQYAAGEITLSGQHEHMIVVRRDGSLEIHDTVDLGFPIGLEQDIETFIGQATVRLEPGDGFVLFTDGVTEAENVERAQYGLERLCEVIRQHWAHSPEAIKLAVVADLKRYIGTQTVYDDITLVVAKQE